MSKIKKLTPGERLSKELAGLAPFEAELHLLLPAQVWPFVEALCRLHLQSDTKEAADLVAQLALTLRQEALRKFGHDTLETFALARMLREGTARWHPPVPQVDSVTHINGYPNKAHRFSMDQEQAANDIGNVWKAFSKFLDVSSRSIGGGGSARSQALGPVEVMGEDLWNHHREVFKPWQNVAARTVVERRTHTGHHLSIAAVVFKVLVEDIYPEQLDNRFALVKGTALRALKAGLDAYYAPERLGGWGKPPPAPQAAPLAAKPEAGGPAPAQNAQNSPSNAPAPPKRPPGLWQTPKPSLPPGGKVKLGPRKKI